MSPSNGWCSIIFHSCDENPAIGSATLFVTKTAELVPQLYQWFCRRFWNMTTVFHSIYLYMYYAGASRCDTRRNPGVRNHAVPLRYARFVPIVVREERKKISESLLSILFSGAGRR